MSLIKHFAIRSHQMARRLLRFSPDQPYWTEIDPFADVSTSLQYRTLHRRSMLRWTMQLTTTDGECPLDRVRSVELSPGFQDTSQNPLDMQVRSRWNEAVERWKACHSAVKHFKDRNASIETRNFVHLA